MHYSLFKQIQQDTTQQHLLEQQLAQLITHNKAQSHSAFSRFCPGVLSLLQQDNLQQRFALFCNRLGNPAVVDRSSVSAVYSLEPQVEAEKEVVDFVSAAPFIMLTPQPDDADNAWPTEVLPAQADVVLMFGLGLGQQIIPLLTRANIHCLVIYEPDASMLQCSAQAINWQDVFAAAAASNTLISLQIGQDASNIASDLNELCQHLPGLNKIYLYRHFSHPVMDEVIAGLFSHNGDKAQLLKPGRQYLGYQQANDYLPVRFNGVLGNKSYQLAAQTQTELFLQNLAAFEHYYPAIATEMYNFIPQSWNLVKDNHNSLNLWHRQRNALLFYHPEQEARAVIEHFLHQPAKDDVILGQKVPWKFRHYVHYQAIAKLQPLFSQIAQQQHAVPQQLASLILFGIGQGCFLSELFSRRDITNLYICEPNIEHFYASLFTLDWQLLLEQAEQTGRRIYLNIGGDGSDYFNDLMQQFYTVGAFTIANTYMLQTNNAPSLTAAVKKLKSQLGVVLTIGDYYDHARFGISHTFKSLELGHSWLKAERNSYLQHKATQLPVFVVGNGPSLDQCADYIKEHRDNIIVVSCGTALKPLYQLGIMPDFHAEVEQNRSTYKWITQVNDAAYLKQIKLLSVNGVHPDTAALFGGTYLAFKEGEASTTLFNKTVSQTQSFAQLAYAYPTVSNLAINWLLQAGFKQLYLLGVDLGYVDINNHHSRLSGYYKEDGTQVYDYGKVHSANISVTGNFRPRVQTKIEFDVSRQVIEQTLKAFAGQAEVYNCSDGAYIQGAVPLQPAQILTFKPDASVSATLADFLQHSCITPALAEQLDEFKAFYHGEKLNRAITIWRKLLTQPIEDFDSAKLCIDKQWTLFKQQSALPDSIIFYLLYGSTSYFLSLMTKLLPGIAQEESELSAIALEQFNTILTVWQQYLADVAEDFQSNPFKLDETAL